MPAEGVEVPDATRLGRTTPIGVCLAAFADLPLADALGRVGELGLRLVDLPTDSLFEVRPERACGPTEDPTAIGRLRDLLDRHGTRVACISNSRDAQLVLGPHGPHTDRVLVGDAAAKRAHGLRYAAAAIRLAGALEVPLVRLMLGCSDFGRWLTWSGSSVSWDDNVEAWVAEAAPLAALARDVGVTLCIEPHVKQVAYDVASTRACLDGLRATGATVSVCLDAANVAALRYDPVAFLEALGEAPSCVHAKDIQLSHDVGRPDGPGWVAYGPQPAMRFRSVPLGELDWAGMVAALDAVGFDGPILIEHEDLVTERMAGIAAAAEHLAALTGAVPPPGRVVEPPPRPSPSPAASTPSPSDSQPWW